jgi:hypothetical protein
MEKQAWPYKEPPAEWPNWWEQEVSHYLPRIVVKFRDELQFPYQGPIQDDLQVIYKKQVRSLLERGDIKVDRLFISLTPQQIERLVKRAVELHPDYQPPNMRTYFAIEYSEAVDPYALVAALREQPEVQAAYVEGRRGPPMAFQPIGSNPLLPLQGYLEAAKTGINARAAWANAGQGGAGEEIQLMDVEQGWKFNHPDLPPVTKSPKFGVNQVAFYYHGTAVLGVIVGADNQEGGVGIAPKASASAISEWRRSSDPTPNTEDAIQKAADTLRPGDVLLLETNLLPDGSERLLPVEVELAVFEQIELAAKAGITVVEAAGNGAFNLDQYEDADGKHMLDRNKPQEFKDSGAIMVAGARLTEAKTWEWRHPSNLGSRIDCFAWGEQIVAPWVNPDGSLTYTQNFGNTSGASAVIAGAALIVQSLAKASFNKTYQKFGELRGILAAHGTGSQHAIGVMPDLAKIMANLPQPAP